MKLSDIFLKSSSGEIISVVNPYADYYIFKIKPQESITWTPGEQVILGFPESRLKGNNKRTFSIASIKEEGFLMFATRIGKASSAFKDYIMHASLGTKVKINGPFGKFKLRNVESPIILFAGEIGITSIFSMIKQLENDQRNVHIVYQSSDYYLFEKEIFDIVRKSPHMDIVFTKTKEETHSVLESFVKTYGNKAYYYNSGPKSVTESNIKLLRSLKVKKSHIINNLFLGYK